MTATENNISNSKSTIPILRLDDFTDDDDVDNNYAALPANNQTRKILTRSDYHDCFLCSYLSCYSLCPDQSCCFDICIVESYTAQIGLCTTKITPRKNIQIKQFSCCFVCLFMI